MATSPPRSRLLAYLVGPRGFGLILVWMFNLVGCVDLLFGFYRGFTAGLIRRLLHTDRLVPLLLVTHALVLIRLLRKEAGAEADDGGTRMTVHTRPSPQGGGTCL